MLTKQCPLRPDFPYPPLRESTGCKNRLVRRVVTKQKCLVPRQMSSLYKAAMGDFGGPLTKERRVAQGCSRFVRARVGGTIPENPKQSHGTKLSHFFANHLILRNYRSPAQGAILSVSSCFQIFLFVAGQWCASNSALPLRSPPISSVLPCAYRFAPDRRLLSQTSP